MIAIRRTPAEPPRRIVICHEESVLKLPVPPEGGPADEVAARAAVAALFQLRRGSPETARALYRRAHSLLREIRRHLALLEDRLPAA